jgi:hypothetical protein
MLCREVANRLPADKKTFADYSGKVMTLHGTGKCQL